MYTDTFRKGDLVAFCFDLGNVTSEMLNVYAQQLWQFNQTANTNDPSTINPDIYEGTPAYLLGMSYYNYVDQFKAINSSLHKVQLVSQYEQGYGLLRPQRDSSGNLINGGQVNLITPAVHMPNNGLATIFNASTHPDSGQDYRLGISQLVGAIRSARFGGRGRCLEQFLSDQCHFDNQVAATSGHEHGHAGRRQLCRGGSGGYNGEQLQNADTNTWSIIANYFNTDLSGSDAVAFMTPGIVTNGSYIGVGAFYFSYDIFDAAVGGLNGGYADNFPTTTFTYANSPNITVTPAPADSTTPFQLLTTATADSSGDSGNVVDGATATWTQPSTETSLVNGQTQLDPALSATLAGLQTMYGSQQNSASAYNQLYNVGTASTEVSTYNDLSQRSVRTGGHDDGRVLH